MSQSFAPRGRTWSGTSVPGVTRSTRGERYRELKQLEQTARKSSKEIKTLEAEIRDLSASFERLQKKDAHRVQRLGKLSKLTLDEEGAEHDSSSSSSENVDTGEPKENGHCQVEGSADAQETNGDLGEELEMLEREHEAAQSHLLSTNATLQQKRVELEILVGAYKALTDQIDKEEQDLQAAEQDESLQPVKHLSEDLGRLTRLMEGLKEGPKDSNTDQLKQNLRRPQKPRVFHPVTSLRSKNLLRNYQNGGASDLGRATSAPVIMRSKEVTRIKEPAEFEEREGGGTRKRQKNSSFESQLEQLQEQRAKLEMEAKEKKTLLDSLASLSAQATEAEASRLASSRGMSRPRQAVSPSSVFERFEESPSLVLAQSGSTRSTSASSDLSSEVSVEKVEKGSAAKRLDFESAKKVSFSSHSADLADTACSSASKECFTRDVLEYEEQIVSETSLEVPAGIESEGSSSEKGEEEVEVLYSEEKGTEEIHGPAEDTESHKPSAEPATGREGGEEIGRLSEAPWKVAEERISVEEGITARKGASDVDINRTAWEEFKQPSDEELIGAREGADEVERTSEGGEISTEEAEEVDKPVVTVEYLSQGDAPVNDAVGDAVRSKGEFDSLSDVEALGKEEALTQGNGVDEIKIPWGEELDMGYGVDDIEYPWQGPLTAGHGVDDIEMPWQGPLTTGNGVDDTEVPWQGPLTAGNGVDDIDVPWQGPVTAGNGVDDIEVPWQGPLTAGNIVDELEIPSEEALATENGEDDIGMPWGEDTLSIGNGVDEIDTLLSEDDDGLESEEIDTLLSEDDDGLESEEIMAGNRVAPFITQGGNGNFQKPSEINEISGIEESEDGVGAGQTYQLQETYQNCFRSVQQVVDGQQTPPKAEQVPPEERRMLVKDTSIECTNWRLEAENQVTQLSSQLSFLQKQVEEELELHQKARNHLQLENSAADTEHFRKQVDLFADEVGELRQSIDEIQRKLYKDGGDGLILEHWAKDLQSKCADQSAQLENLGKQVYLLDKEVKNHLKVSSHIEGKLDKEEQERLRVEAQLISLSKALAHTVSTIEKEEAAVGELVEQQKHLLVDQLREAEKLRHIAEVRAETLNKQIEHLELVCDVAQNLRVVSKYQDKVLKYGLQTFVQLFMLVVGVITLYSRVAKPLGSSLVPT